MAEKVDTLIHARWLVPVEPARQVIEGASIALRGGRIVSVGERDQISVEADEEFSLDDHVLLPGFVNAHGHAAMVLFRGYADDMRLQAWLDERIWPLEHAWVDQDFVRDGTELAIAEMLRAGTTCFSDMYYFPEAAARAACDAGLRAQITFPIVRFPNNWSRDADDCIHRGLALRDDLRSQRRLIVGFGPHATYTLEPKNLERIATYATELDAPVQIHLHETTAEVENAVKETGERPLDLVERVGLLGPTLQTVHMTQLTDADIETLAATDTAVVHCPQSNLKLASGIAPIAAMRRAGIRLGLGTDGAAGNNGLSMMREMNAASLLAKISNHDATELSAFDALHLATLGGAIALGLGDEIGSLVPGKSGDIIAIDLSELETQPVYNPISHLVYTACAHKVSHLWCEGELLMRERVLLTLDEDRVGAHARAWAERISKS
ncbi:MAG: TRZ/ATZ family hydrolase [Gammaproteobacteria bacterium]|nr:TRZ/ATZ family hydrolase [Gammaproteobacteria bacterium]